jgi:hypothetical protein
MAHPVYVVSTRLTLLALLASTPVMAQETREWGQSGSWLISVDPTLNNSCFILHEYEDGTVLRIGLDMSSADERWYILFGNDRWQSIEAGGEYDIAVQFDREPEWTAVAEGVDMDAPANFLYIFGTDVEFFDEFIYKNTLNLFYEGESIARLSLSGSARATGEMIECQEAQVSASTPDPFSGKKKKSGSDPFSN